MTEFFSQDSGGWESKIERSAELAPREASLLGSRAAVSLCVFTWSSLCACLCPNLLLKKSRHLGLRVIRVT